MLNNKSAMRMAFSELIPVVPFQELTYSDNLNLSGLLSNNSMLIFQENNSSGGYGTHVVNIATNHLKQFVGKTFMVSPYIENSVSVNVHIIIGHNTIIYFPGSIQII